jgi:hypothetical protein
MTPGPAARDDIAESTPVRRQNRLYKNLIGIKVFTD